MWWENYDFDQLPFGIRTGLGYIMGTTNIVVDWHKMFYRFGDIEHDNLYSIGVEQAIGSVLVLRAGAQTASIDKTDEIKYTYGAGINISVITVSLAGETYKLENESVAQYSVSVKASI